MIIYCKYENGKVKKSPVKVDDTWTEVNISSLNDTIEYDESTKTFRVTDSLTQKKRLLESQAVQLLEKYILTYYDDKKQKSDVSDETMYQGWLRDVTGKTLDEIQKTVYDAAYKIIFGIDTFENVAATFPTTQHKFFHTYMPESIGWIQLLKIAIRVSFVQQCKLVLYQVLEKIKNADSNTIKAIDLNQELINKLPKFPL